LAAAVVSGVCASTNTLFIDNSSISLGFINSWNWNLNGEGTSLNQFPVFNFSIAGTKNISLVVTSDMGCTDTTLFSFDVQPKPIASFSYAPSLVVASQPVTFTNTSVAGSNTPFTSSWTFEGTNFSSQVNPSYTFLNEGQGDVSLIISDQYNCKDTFQTFVGVGGIRRDIATTDVLFTGQNDFYTVTAQLENQGNVIINSLDLYLRINDGSYIKEIWTGSLPAGTSLLYTFAPQVFALESENYFCVNADKTDGLNDDVLSNNQYCVPIENSSLILYPLYPNPGNGAISLPVFIPKKDEVRVNAFNARGQLISSCLNQILEKGMHFITIDATTWADGIYMIRFEYRDKQELIKFFRKD
jgi:hypothetical protein